MDAIFNQTAWACSKVFCAPVPENLASFYCRTIRVIGANPAFGTVVLGLSFLPLVHKTCRQLKHSFGLESRTVTRKKRVERVIRDIGRTCSSRNTRLQPDNVEVNQSFVGLNKLLKKETADASAIPVRNSWYICNWETLLPLGATLVYGLAQQTPLRAFMSLLLPGYILIGCCRVRMEDDGEIRKLAGGLKAKLLEASKSLNSAREMIFNPLHNKQLFVEQRPSSANRGWYN